MRKDGLDAPPVVGGDVTLALVEEQLQLVVEGRRRPPGQDGGVSPRQSRVKEAVNYRHR